jgi:hypothetical protein
MNVIKKCELCETPLELEVDGRKALFTAHSPELCAAATAYRIRMLDQMAKHATLQATAWREELERALRTSRTLATGVGEAIDMMKRGALARIVLTALEDLLFPKEPPRETLYRDDFSQTRFHATVDASGRVPSSVAADALHELSVASGQSMESLTPPEHAVDLHHSQGVTVAAVIAGTPLSRVCEACKAPIAAACIDIGYPPKTGPDGFHEVRRHPSTPESVPQR